jgi:hypothetical protein
VSVPYVGQIRARCTDLEEIDALYASHRKKRSNPIALLAELLLHKLEQRSIVVDLIHRLLKQRFELICLVYTGKQVKRAGTCSRSIDSHCGNVDALVEPNEKCFATFCLQAEVSKVHFWLVECLL